MIGTPMPSLIFTEIQLELPTVIAHEPLLPPKDTHKPAGIRLAKMLSQYDDSPSSQLWADIQRLAREILK
jgi:hypothetical protein